MAYVVLEQEQNYYRYRARLDYLREQSSICCYHQGMTKEILDIVMETEKILSQRLELLSESSSEYQEIQLKLMENISKQELLKKEYDKLENDISEFSKQQKDLTKEYELSKATEREKELLAEIEHLKTLLGNQVSAQDIF